MLYFGERSLEELNCTFLEFISPPLIRDVDLENCGPRKG